MEKRGWYRAAVWGTLLLLGVLNYIVAAQVSTSKNSTSAVAYNLFFITQNEVTSKPRDVKGIKNCSSVSLLKANYLGFNLSPSLPLSLSPSLPLPLSPMANS